MKDKFNYNIGDTFYVRHSIIDDLLKATITKNDRTKEHKWYFLEIENSNLSGWHTENFINCCAIWDSKKAKELRGFIKCENWKRFI